MVLWWHNGKWAARDNEWKLIDVGSGPELYHIIGDIGETTDVYAGNPAVVDRLYSHYTNTLAEFDIVTDASRWSSNSTYYMDITDPAYHVIYEATNVTEWLESAYPGTDTDKDGISNYIEFMHGLPLESPSALSDGVAWNLAEIAQSNLSVTYRKRVGSVGENSLPVSGVSIEQTGMLESNAWEAADAVLTDGPNATESTNVVEVSYLVNVPDEPRGFFRLKYE
jgi:hypothetical protein